MGKYAGGEVMHSSVKEDVMYAKYAFTTANGANPTETGDNGGVFGTMTRTGVGTFSLPITDDWADVKLLSVQMESGTFAMWQATGYTLTAGVQAIALKQMDAVGAALDTLVAPGVAHVALYRK